MSIDNASDRKAAQHAAAIFLEELEELNRLMEEKKAEQGRNNWGYEPEGLKRARGRTRRASHTLSEALVDLRRY